MKIISANISVLLGIALAVHVSAQPSFSTVPPGAGFSRQLAFNVNDMTPGGGGLFGSEDNWGGQDALRLGHLAKKHFIEEFESARDAFLSARRDYDWFAAEEAGRKARLMAEDSNDPLRLGLADAVLGTALVQLSRFKEAEPILKRGRQTLEKEQGPDDIYTLWTIARLAEISLQQGRLAECLAMSRDLPDRASGEGSKEELIAALQDARYWPAMAAVQLGQFDEAEKIFESILADTRGISDKLVLRERARALQLLAELRQRQNRNAEAIAAARESLQLRRKSDPGSGFEVAGLISLADQLLAAGDEDEARPLIEKAASLAKRRLGSGDLALGRALLLNAQHNSAGSTSAKMIDELSSALAIFRSAGAREELAMAARLLASQYASRNEVSKALALYREALDNIDYMFAATRGLGDRSRQYFLERFLPHYHEVVRYLLELELQQPSRKFGHQALEAVSRTQSRIFTELLRQALAGRDAGDTAFQALKSERDSARQRLDGINERLMRLPKTDDDEVLARRVGSIAAGLRDEAKQLQGKLNTVEKRLWNEYPRFMELTEPRPVTVDVLQQKHLDANETLLGYYLQRRQVVIFMISRNQFTVRAVSHDDNEVTQTVQRVRQAMDMQRTLDPADLHRLYQLLLAPVIKSLPDKGRIIVVGDGPLHALPLEILLTRWNKEDQKKFVQARKHKRDAYADLAYASRQWRFSYMPSFAALVAIREAGNRVPEYTENMISFADPVFSQKALASLPGLPKRDVQLVRLEETAQEAQQIAGILGGASDIYLRTDAQEYKAKGIRHGQARYLHFATHGLLGGQFLMIKSDLVDGLKSDSEKRGLRQVDAQPTLVLSLSGDMRGEDGFLTMSDVIETMHTDAELVVLSACNTAGEGGDPGGGEGFAGMTRAFMFAGARGLYVSHWSVESEATRDLMLEAFKRLSAGMKPVDALAEAQAVIRSSPGRGNPVFWAPFVYVGR